MTAYTRLAAVILAGATLFGCATTAQNAKPNSAKAVQNPACLTETGSKINGPQCRGYGRSYSSADIDRTGRMNAGDALATLDPAITVHH